ncbi:DUF6252 family protein [Moheibacter sediminis]|nr:DUF6252 family protein [Moheibacter sediminis]
MKTIKKLNIMMLLLISSAIFTFSCKSDDDGGNAGPAAEGTIVAKVDGTTITTLEMVTFANLVSGTLSIQGNTGGTSSKALTLLINGIDGVGTYPLGGGANIANSASYMEIVVDMSNPMNTQTHTWQAPYDSSQAGEIKISEMTATHVKGTFSFSCKNVNGDNSVKNVTEGSFNIQL